MKPSILIDATHCMAKAPSGVELYTDSLLPVLAEKLIVSGVHPIFVSHGVKPAHFSDEIEWQVSAHQLGWAQRVIPSLIKRHSCAAYFTPSGIPPLSATVPTFFTVHDLSVYQFPGSYSLRERLRTTVLAHKAAVRAAAIFVPSRYTAQQVVEYWNIPPERVIVTPLAVPSESAQPETSSPLPDIPNDLPQIVCIGRLVSKKDVQTLIRGFAKLSGAQLARLVLVGSPGYGYQEIEVALAELEPEVRERVHILSYVSADQKRQILDRATVVAVPGPYEGFGIPALEALAVGKLVVATHSGAVAEVTGELALYAEAHTPASWTSALTSALVTRELHAQVRQLGPKRAKQFSWEGTAEATAEAILAVLERSR